MEHTKLLRPRSTNNSVTYKVINDTVERGVKLMEEFNDKITKVEDQKQFLLKVSNLYK